MMILMEPSDLGVAKLKVLLLCFENMSGLEINFDKCEAIVTGVLMAKKVRIANRLNFKLGKFPIKYLGLPISDRELSVADWGFLPQKLGHRV
jgi:hypothetical protein